ncbi:MAG TPA: PilZ domain-containing protein [Candidatus Acidoferrales bacterium]|nr:PilZ domain-containing protein [Candidatus Acidoferrales bacterium]
MALLKERKRQRRHPRIKVRKILLVAWQGAGHRDACRARNLCLGGIYINTRDPVDVGEIVELFFDTPDGEVRTRAVVRSMHFGRGMGVEFIGMDFLERRHLHARLKTLLTSEERAEEPVSA